MSGGNAIAYTIPDGGQRPRCLPSAFALICDRETDCSISAAAAEELSSSCITRYLGRSASIPILCR